MDNWYNVLSITTLLCSLHHVKSTVASNVHEGKTGIYFHQLVCNRLTNSRGKVYA